VPTIPICFEDNAMFAVGIGVAVVGGQKIDQPVSALASEFDGDALRSVIKVVQCEEFVVAPIVAEAENAVLVCVHDAIVAPPEFGNFLSGANDALGPVQE